MRFYPFCIDALSNLYRFYRIVIVFSFPIKPPFFFPVPRSTGKQGYFPFQKAVPYVTKI
nr:MAG TPA: hypothetical protein [Caudoviricetes sp.]